MTLPDHLKGTLVGRSRAGVYDKLVLRNTSELRGQVPIERVWPQLTDAERTLALQSSLLLHPEGKYSEDWIVNDKSVFTWSDGEVWIEIDKERLDALIGQLPARVRRR